MNGQDNQFSFKDFFYRFCFFLGLGTAAYCSYAQVKTWVKDEAPIQTTQALKERVQMSESSSAFAQALPNVAPMESAHAAPAVAPTSLIPEASLVKSDASPSPSPATTEALPAADASQAPMAYVEPLPYAFNPEYPAQMMRAPAQEESHSAMNPASAPSAPVAVGQGSLLNTGDKQNSVNGSSSSVYTGSSVSAASGLASQLNSGDMVLLNSSMKGSLPDQTVTVSGLYCGGGSQMGSGCSHENHFSIHTSRYSSNEGLASDASFSITGSSAGNLMLHMGIKLQDSNSAYQTLSLTSALSDVSVRTEVRSGHAIRIFDIKVPTLVVRGNEQLQKVQIVIAFDVANPDAPVLLSESSVSFSRKSVKLVPLAWNFAAPSPVASNEPVMIADEIPYSMSIEKSQ